MKKDTPYFYVIMKDGLHHIVSGHDGRPSVVASYQYVEYANFVCKKLNKDVEEARRNRELYEI